MKSTKASAALLGLALATGAATSAASAAAPSVAAASSAPAVAASQASEVTGGIRIQDSLVLYARHTQADPLEVYFEVDLAHPDGVDTAAATITGPDGYLYGIDLTRTSGTEAAGTWAGGAHFTKHDPTGLYRLSVQVQTNTGQHLPGPAQSLSVKRNTRMPAFNASPEPVRKGAPVEVYGQLTRLDPDLGYVGYPGKTLAVYFRPTGGEWTLKGTVTTGTAGTWSRSFPATVDGTWQARFAGTSNYHAEASRNDYVDVR